MSYYYQTNPSRLAIFKTENLGWERTIGLLQQEIPLLENMLGSTAWQNKSATQCKQHFKDCLEKIKSRNLQLNAQIEAQLKRLESDEQENMLYDLDAIYTQTILRNSIKDTEKEFTELRHSFMQVMTEYIH